LLESDKFKILYSGNIGAKQDWDFFVDVAKHFKDNNQVEFIIVGAGAKKEWVIENTKEFNNIKHYMPIEYNTLANLLCSANLHILFQKNDVVDTVMPSKLLGMMASAVPSVVTGNLNSEVAKVFEKSKGGYFLDSNNLKGVVEAIEELITNSELSKQMGQNAREYIVENFSSSRVLSNFQNKVNETIKIK